ncbi:hypothetical protein ACIQZO_13690 [Streptomyces sp. NPDC097617]|uniref:hypothetical protein n=1 Tax=Streptomyces sp. NPDC097617 TaxID=3366091 RepID=UPI0038032803
MPELIAPMVLGLTSVTALLLVLLPSRRAPGKHSGAYRPKPAPATVSPWSRPWTGPSSADARRIFRPETDAETTLVLSPVQRERRYAAEFAAIGVDYPYTYKGAPFPRSAFPRSAFAVAVSA